MAEDRLASLVGGGHDVVVALQRIAGLKAQRRYLIATAQRYLLEPRSQLATVAHRNRRDIEKLSRPKNAGKTFDPVQMDKRFTRPPRRLRQAEMSATERPARPWSASTATSAAASSRTSCGGT
jgi:hypothetical protein